MFQTHVYQPFLSALVLDLMLMINVYQQRLGRNSHYLQLWTQLSTVPEPHRRDCVC